MTACLEDIACALVGGGKGILAIDESSDTIKKRFDAISLESTEENRRDYREMLLSSVEAMSQYISGVIFHQETIRQKSLKGSLFMDLLKTVGSIPGVKVDIGARPLAGFPGERLTEGLDGLRKRLNEYSRLGLRFAKWRTVISIDHVGLPTMAAVRKNAQALARYAALCQESGILPVIEPEVLMDGIPGDHSIDRCYEVTKYVLEEAFTALREAYVKFEGLLLKPNMVIDGKEARRASIDEVAEKTIRCLKQTVPAAVPGIAFLSGGQSAEEATAHLSAMNAGSNSYPWVLTFSYGRALQTAALIAWGGKRKNVLDGQRALIHRAKMNSLAALGQWSQDAESSS
ncbi:MAG: class I [Candidatus Tokpelaia sp. JSC161]|jgi:fructose-bisphosphate aldolase class I|nr:MAG: class I [Candidatus Tokpelaia sp. JSC161]